MPGVTAGHTPAGAVVEMAVVAVMVADAEEEDVVVAVAAAGSSQIETFSTNDSGKRRRLKPVQRTVLAF
jgi:hypothetical protein